jgi:hypothetical protein
MNAQVIVTCANCRFDVPAGRYCVRCGDPLEGEQRARGFAAAPNERYMIPRLVSTIFPHLPRASLQTFRVALAIGTAVVVALAALRLLPIAVIAAAALVPLLTVLYFYDVDVYEDEPFRVTAVTIVWGIVAGVATGIVTEALSPSGAQLLVELTRATVIRGLVIPFVAALLMLAGPLLLLRYRKFNDVLDGATFGAASAVAFTGAQVITQSTSFFTIGLRPVARITPWLFRVVELGVLLPLLTAGVIGGAAGALWMRYRAPVRDRGALGPLGRPPVSIALAIATLMGASLVQLRLGTYAAFAVLAVLTAGALLWLRRVIHVGLLQEAAEIPIGPDIVCANCGHATASHTFCQSCGISLRALPKERHRSAVLESAPQA